MPLLSIIIPFYNSEGKCGRLLARLQQSAFSDVELVLVDDGSSDQTRNILEQFSKSSLLPTKLVFQENMGPGGARNTGLKHSEGHYVWFVDSDDDVFLDKALKVLRRIKSERYDVIDFDVIFRERRINTMDLKPGIYSESCAKKFLLKRFGRIVSKIFRRGIFTSNDVRFPEFCIYEDNPLQFIIPFFVLSIFKSPEYVYIHHDDNDSITRGTQGDRHYDKMLTAIWGHKFARKILTVQDRNLLYEVDSYLVRLYLQNTVKLTRFPSYSWLAKARVMKQFRADTRGVDLLVRWPEFSSLRQELRFALIWYASFFLRSQEKYFLAARQRAWGRPFVAPDIQIPPRIQAEED